METVISNPHDVAFDIGWDFARFGRCIDRTVADQTVVAGYRAGREHFRVPQHSPDRYVSKWLQLRMNAFRRRRVLSEDVTPAYLKRIDCTTCPITLIDLTHSALADSDWSVDRINNDGAYAAGNLMVISTRANRAKGAKRYQEVASLAKTTSNNDESELSAREWGRMACLMIGAEGITESEPALGPLLTRIPEDCRVPLFFLLQQMVLVSTVSSPLRNHLVRSLGRLHPTKDKHLLLSCAAQRLSVIRRPLDYAYDALADDTVLRLLRNWYTTLPVSANYNLLQFCTAYGAQHLEPQLPPTWSVATRGRF